MQWLGTKWYCRKEMTRDGKSKPQEKAENQNG